MAQWSWLVHDGVWHSNSVSSFSTEVVLPVGQVAHESTFANGASSGLDMYVPAEQQPRRPVVPEYESVKKSDHLPPHTVRLKPLFVNTVRKEGYNAKNPKSVDTTDNSTIVMSVQTRFIQN